MCRKENSNLMTMKKFLLPMVSVAALLLSGCATKVSYEKFHEKAEAASKLEVKVTKGSIKYAYKSGSKESNANYTMVWNAGNKYWTVQDASLLDLDIATIVNTFAVNVGEDEEDTYYAGGGQFKVVEEDGDTWKFQKNGFLTSYKTETTTITVKYSR